MVVDGVRVEEPGLKVDPESADVRVDGASVKPAVNVYFAVHKPQGYVCSNADDERRKRVIDLLPAVAGRVYTVGRLDADSSGLILVTNDGPFADRVMHPRYEVAKTYDVVVKGRASDMALDRVRSGVRIGSETTGTAGVEVIEETPERTRLVVTLREGKNREVRRMLARVGLPVLALVRTHIGAVGLGNLGVGKVRSLSSSEVEALLGSD